MPQDVVAALEALNTISIARSTGPVPAFQRWTTQVDGRYRCSALSDDLSDETNREQHFGRMHEFHHYDRPGWQLLRSASSAESTTPAIRKGQTGNNHHTSFICPPTVARGMGDWPLFSDTRVTVVAGAWHGRLPIFPDRGCGSAPQWAVGAAHNLPVVLAGSLTAAAATAVVKATTRAQLDPRLVHSPRHSSAGARPDPGVRRRPARVDTITANKAGGPRGQQG